MAILREHELEGKNGSDHRQRVHPVFDKPTGCANQCDICFLSGNLPAAFIGGSVAGRGSAAPAPQSVLINLRQPCLSDTFPFRNVSYLGVTGVLFSLSFASDADSASAVVLIPEAGPVLDEWTPHIEMGESEKFGSFTFIYKTL
ncbi:hypothetical protein L596_003504 [Steinernema carpocapsae]|uniref:Uncharacterized protein n=1 Tax=Steinernema carpocapsae TaxID=34508 RepID=A0A4U8USL9_STECR|nr:hypothetical protein L596_003504 [Steinernema carpocapsae]